MVSGYPDWQKPAGLTWEQIRNLLRTEGAYNYMYDKNSDGIIDIESLPKEYNFDYVMDFIARNCGLVIKQDTFTIHSPCTGVYCVTPLTYIDADGSGSWEEYEDYIILKTGTQANSNACISQRLNNVSEVVQLDKKTVFIADVEFKSDTNQISWIEFSGLCKEEYYICDIGFYIEDNVINAVVSFPAGWVMEPIMNFTAPFRFNGMVIFIPPDLYKFYINGELKTEITFETPLCTWDPFNPMYFYIENKADEDKTLVVYYGVFGQLRG